MREEVQGARPKLARSHTRLGGRWKRARIGGFRVSDSLSCLLQATFPSLTIARVPEKWHLLPFGVGNQGMDVWTCGAPPGNGRMWGGVGGPRQRQLKVSGADNGHCVRGTGGALGGRVTPWQECARPVWECQHIIPPTGSPVARSLIWQPRYSEHCGSRIRAWTIRREPGDGEGVAGLPRCSLA